MDADELGVMAILTPARVWLAVLLAVAAVGVSTMWRVQPGTTDIVLDKYQAVEAWAGGDPYMTQSDLVARYELGGYGHPAPSPRSPSAIALESVTILIRDDVLRWLAMAAALATTSLTFYVIGRIGNVDQRLVAGMLLAYVLWRPGRLVWWNVTDISTLLIVSAWWQLRQSARASWLLGLAAALKLWPAAIVVALFTRRDTRGTSMQAAGWAAGFTGIGLLIPSVSIAGTVQAMRAAGEYWGSAPTWVTAVMATLLIATGALVSAEWRFGLAVVAGLLLSPIAWLDYWLAAIPLVPLAVTLIFRSGRWSDVWWQSRSSGLVSRTPLVYRDSKDRSHSGR